MRFGSYSDGDGVLDFDDNCELSPNSDQSDIDGDGAGTSRFILYFYIYLTENQISISPIFFILMFYFRRR